MLFLSLSLVMKILVVAAASNELRAIKEGIKSASLKVNLDIDYLCCGIGNYEAISALEHYLTENKEPTFIWNIGVCGYRNSKNEKKSEPIQVASVFNLHTQKEMIIPPFLQIAPMKNCFCGENIIYEKPEVQNGGGTINDEMYFDMESRGIEFVVSKYKYPRLILKVPFDFVGENNFKSMQNVEIISKLLVYLPYRDYLEKILKWMILGE